MTIASSKNNPVVADVSNLRSLNPTEIENLIRYQQDQGYLISVNPQALTVAVWLLANASSFKIFEKLGLEIHSDEWDNIVRVMLSNLKIESNEESKSYYDSVSSNYDDLYTDGISIAENTIVGTLLTQTLS